ACILGSSSASPIGILPMLVTRTAKTMQFLRTLGILCLAFHDAAAAKMSEKPSINIESLAGIHDTHLSKALASTASDPSSKQLGSVAGALTHLLSAGSEGTNSSAVVDAILELVNVTMKGKLYTGHEKSMQKLTDAEHEFEKCVNHYKAADKVRFPPASFLQANVTNATPWYEEYFESYLWCKNYEAKLSTEVNECDYYCLQETQTVDQNCVALDEECNQIDCAPVTREGYRAFLERMVNTLEGYLVKNTNWTFNNSHKCTDIMGEVETCYRKCDNITTVVKPQSETVLAGCCAPRATAESGKCNELKSRREAWLEYDSCYDSAYSNWELVKADQEAQGISRMAQMRSIQRMVCLIDSFGPEQKTKLKQCDPESKLDIFTCNASEVPGSPEFDALHYSHLPDGISACPAVTCEDACGLSNSSQDYKEVEVCVGLGSWQSTPISSTEGWSQMGAAFHIAANVSCDSELFFNAGSGNCSYAACPEGSVRNVEDLASSAANPTKGPGGCPCKMTMQRKTTTPIPEMTTVPAKCFKQHGKAAYWDLGSSQSLGSVSATLHPGVGRVEVYLTDSGPTEGGLTSTDSCGSITSSLTADCSAKSAGRFLVLKGITAGTCVMGDCDIAWCHVKVDGAELTQDPEPSTGKSYAGEVVIDA
ncbi:unnamed protein product, partial [Durusdinium trenchii]